MGNSNPCGERLPLTERQGEIVEMIRTYQIAHTRGPPLCDVAKMAGQPKDTVRDMLIKIDGKGWVRYTSRETVLA